MDNIISEGLDHIGSINDSGQIFDRAGNHIATITCDGYIYGGGKSLGRIETDGTIRNSMFEVVGHIDADGYIYIHSNRICRVSSTFIANIAPQVRSAGHSSAYYDRSNTSTSSDKAGWPLSFATTLKLVIGVVFGIYAIITSAGDLGFLGCLLAIPLSIAIVFVLCFIFKLFRDFF